MMFYDLCFISILFLRLLIFPLAVSGQDSDQIPLHSSQSHERSSHRIAIIGAGAAGSSAAYHLAKFCNETSDDISIEIDIFESGSYVGGRSTTINALDDPRYPTELGASIFVEVNHILYNLTKEFGLSTRDGISESTGAIYDLGIWDGSSFVFRMANDDDDGWFSRFAGYWDIAKLLWKYGLSPIWTRNAKDTVVSRFLRMYDEYFPIASLTNFVSEVGLDEYTGIDGRAALLKSGVSEQFARDVVQSSTRVNYAQNLDSIHGVETMVCMATDGAMSIDGGNWRIFDQAIQRSGAVLHLNTSVTEVLKTTTGTYELRAKSSGDGSVIPTSKEYDAVILAAPYHFSNITFTSPLSPSTSPAPIDYVTLHVTLFTTPFQPSASFFGVSSPDEVPDTILTTLPAPLELKDTEHHVSRGPDAVGSTVFWSLSTLRTIYPQPNSLVSVSEPQYLYKIFSPAPLTATFVSDLFGLNYTKTVPVDDTLFMSNDNDDNEDPITSLPKSYITWSHTKVWQSYPYLPPILNFSALMLDSSISNYTEIFNNQTTTTPNPADAQAVYYTSGVESFISTMETSALMGRNVARVIIDGLRSASSAPRTVTVPVEEEVEEKEEEEEKKGKLSNKHIKIGMIVGGLFDILF